MTISEKFLKFRKQQKQLNKIIKAKLKGRWFYDHRKFMITGKSIKPTLVPYVKLKTIKRTSFTKELRNKKGYNNHLSNKLITV